MKRRKFLAWVASLPFVGSLFYFLKTANSKDLTSGQCLDLSLRRMQWHLARDFPDVKSHVSIGEPESYVRLEVTDRQDRLKQKLWLSFESNLFDNTRKPKKTIRSEIDSGMKRIAGILGDLEEAFGNKILDVRLVSFECKSYSDRYLRSIELEMPFAQTGDLERDNEDTHYIILNWSFCINGWSLCQKRDLRKSDEYVGFISMDTPRFVMPDALSTLSA